MILALAERAAQADGVDAVVDVIAKDFSSAHRFERVCRELGSAGRVEGYGARQPAWTQQAGHSEMVEVLLGEGDVAAAWQASRDRAAMKS